MKIRKIMNKFFITLALVNLKSGEGTLGKVYIQKKSETVTVIESKDTVALHV
jgi:hypothetical protein